MTHIAAIKGVDHLAFAVDSMAVGVTSLGEVKHYHREVKQHTIGNDEYVVLSTGSVSTCDRALKDLRYEQLPDLESAQEALQPYTNPRYYNLTNFIVGGRTSNGDLDIAYVTHKTTPGPSQLELEMKHPVILGQGGSDDQEYYEHESPIILAGSGSWSSAEYFANHCEIDGEDFDLVNSLTALRALGLAATDVESVNRHISYSLLTDNNELFSLTDPQLYTVDQILKRDKSDLFFRSLVLELDRYQLFREYLSLNGQYVVGGETAGDPSSVEEIIQTQRKLAPYKESIQRGIQAWLSQDHEAKLAYANSIFPE